MKRKTAVLPTTAQVFVANGKVAVKVISIMLESAEQVLYYTHTHMLQTAQQHASLPLPSDSEHRKEVVMKP